MEKKVDIIKDVDGKSIVVINDLRCKGRSVEWNIVEEPQIKHLQKIIHRNIMLMQNPAGNGNSSGKSSFIILMTVI